MAFDLDPLPQDILALEVGGVHPEPLPNSAGIWIPGPVIGTTGYSARDPISIGRCAILAQHLFQKSRGMTRPPALEFCMAYPESTWLTGKGGGLGPGSLPWSNGQQLLEAARRLVPGAHVRSIGWTQKGSADLSSSGPTMNELKAFTTAYDALAQGAPDFYIGTPAALSTSADATHNKALNGIYNFCRANANTRTWATTPWYQWRFRGTDNIHTGAYGTLRHGEVEGYAKFVVEDEGAGAYYPLWRSLSLPIHYLGGGIFKVPFDRPSGMAFARAKMSWQAESEDGIGVAHQYGWRVKIDGVDVTAMPKIDDLDVILETAAAPRVGAHVRISYAKYGPGGLNPGLHSGIWGNLTMVGPPSVLASGKMLNVWAWPFEEGLTI